MKTPAFASILPCTRLQLLTAALAVAATVSTLHAQGTAVEGIKVRNVTVGAVPPNSMATAAFMVIVNDTDKPVRLVGGAAPFADMAGPMITTHEEHGHVMALGMKDVPFLEVPAHGQRELKRGGDHLMLMGLKSVPKEGEKVTLTLRFEPAPAELKVEATVTK